jgi:phospholipase/lecithinase/hemolysin
MRKTILATACLLPALTFAAVPHYSRVIVFGDSLSDIGNMPESPNLIEPAFNAIALNVYVPISNPSINGNPQSYSLVTTGKRYPFPTHAPQPQPPLRVGKQTVTRTAYSLAWPQFFTARASGAGLLKSAEIWPWFWWKTHPNKNPNLSIDYAWAGAVTDDVCRNFSYENPNKNCNANSMLAGQAAYRAKAFGTTGSKPVDAVQVPGLGKQVQLFLQDSKQHPELARVNTLYAVLIGGNDLNLALMDLKHKKIISAFGRVLHGAAMRVRQNIETLIEKRGARHIVLFNLLNTSQIPYIQTELWRHNLIPIKDKPSFIKFSRLMTDIYNRELKFVVHRINRRYNSHVHQVDIQLFDFYNVMQSVQDLPAFSSKQTLYQTCIGNSTTRPASYYGSMNSCIEGKDKYLFWNGAHPAMYLDQVVADKLLTQLQTQAKLTNVER